MEYKEIFKLRYMLDEANIPYHFIYRTTKLIVSTYPSYQIIVYKPNNENVIEPERLISVVEGSFTYGSEYDLLEIMGCLTDEEYKNDSVLGYLKADEVFERIKREYFKGEE